MSYDIRTLHALPMSRLKKIGTEIGIHKVSKMKASDKNSLIAMILNPKPQHLNLTRLKAIAKDLGIPNISSYNSRNRNALINRITQAQVGGVIQDDYKGYDAPSEPTLGDMTMTALKKLAKSLRVKGYTKYKASQKASLINLIQNAQQGIAQPQPVISGDGLSAMNITNLKKRAKAIGLVGYSKYKASQKATLINRIRTHQQGGAQPPPARPAVALSGDLEAMGITKLKKIAKELGIPGYTKFKLSDKLRLISLIRARTSPPGTPVRSPSPVVQRIMSRSPQIIRQRSPSPVVRRTPSPVVIQRPRSPSPALRSPTSLSVDSIPDISYSPISRDSPPRRVSPSVSLSLSERKSPSYIPSPDYTQGFPERRVSPYVPASPPSPVLGEPSPTYRPLSPTREIQITPRASPLYDPTYRGPPSPDYGTPSPPPIQRRQRVIPPTPSPSPSPVRRPTPQRRSRTPPRPDLRSARVFQSGSPKRPIPPRSPAVRPTAGLAQVLSPRETHHIFTAPRILTLQELQNVLTNMNVMEAEQSKSYVREDVDRCLGLM